MEKNFKVCFQTTKRLFHEDYIRLCYFLNKWTEYGKYNLNYQDYLAYIATKIIWPTTLLSANMEHTIPFFQFTDRELRFWVDCFSLFGILLSEKEKALRFRLNTIDITEKLKQIPTPEMIRDNFHEVIMVKVFLKHPNEENKKFLISKNISHRGSEVTIERIFAILTVEK